MRRARRAFEDSWAADHWPLLRPGHVWQDSQVVNRCPRVKQFTTCESWRLRQERQPVNKRRTRLVHRLKILARKRPGCSAGRRSGRFRSSQAAFLVRRVCGAVGLARCSSASNAQLAASPRAASAACTERALAPATRNRLAANLRAAAACRAARAFAPAPTPGLGANPRVASVICAARGFAPPASVLLVPNPRSAAACRAARAIAPATRHRLAANPRPASATCAACAFVPTSRHSAFASCRCRLAWQPLARPRPHRQH